MQRVIVRPRGCLSGLAELAGALAEPAFFAEVAASSGRDGVVLSRRWVLVRVMC